MENISSTAELQHAIQLLEAEQDLKLLLVKYHFHQAYESLKPANLIQNTLKEIAVSPHLANNFLGAGVGLATGYLSKKAVSGQSNNKFRRFLGIIVQFGITNIIARNPKTIQSIGRFVSHHIFHKEE